MSECDNCNDGEVELMGPCPVCDPLNRIAWMADDEMGGDEGESPDALEIHEYS